LINFIAVKIKDILAFGKKYPWVRPETCPRCGGVRVWGHGFVWAFFDEAPEGLWLRRYRCPECGCVIRLRPLGYLARFQVSLPTIRTHITQRLLNSRWPPAPKISKSRQRHWLFALKRKTEAWFNKTWNSGFIEAFDRLCLLGQNPVSRAI